VSRVTGPEYQRGALSYCNTTLTGFRKDRPGLLAAQAKASL
jgi:hypothetical protein